MLDVKNHILVRDNALDSNICDNLIELFENNPQLYKQGISGTNDGGKNTVEKVKKSTDIGIDNSFLQHPDFSQPVKLLIDCLHDTTDKYVEKFPELTQVPNWGLKAQFNLQRYLPEEGFFAWHCEYNPHNDYTNKHVLAWMIYLNTVTDGGGTEFSNNYGSVQAVKGRCVIWPAYWTHFHRGIVSPTQTKYIATGWYGFM